jgi:hypothetical protein
MGERRERRDKKPVKDLYVILLNHVKEWKQGMKEGVPRVKSREGRGEDQTARSRHEGNINNSSSDHECEGSRPRPPT